MQCGALIALDQEGRTYAAYGGEILNWVNEAAYEDSPDHENYRVPGGDGFWPAPEGTRMGYFYARGRWSVPPALTSARRDVVASGQHEATIQLNADLINSRGRGVPVTMTRHVDVQAVPNGVKIRCKDRITYCGCGRLDRQDALIAPWSLCPVPHGAGCTVKFPAASDDDVWDLYDPSDSHRTIENRIGTLNTDGTLQYQVGLSRTVDWVEFHDPKSGLRVRRSGAEVPKNFSYIDIRDASPDREPDPRGVRFSVYCDGSRGFTELEAAGGMPSHLDPGDELTLDTVTQYTAGAR